MFNLERDAELIGCMIYIVLLDWRAYDRHACVLA
jgi:hypothetical protein